jgi:starch synthase (maltosyl-transferring)
MATGHAAPRRADLVSARTEGTEFDEGHSHLVPAGRVRPVVASVRPQVDGGRRPAKAAVGDTVVVEADAFADGHDVLTCGLRFRHDGDHQWSSVSMAPIGNDRWRAEFAVRTMGHYRFVVHARVDDFLTWRRDLRVRLDAGQDVAVELLVGAELVDQAARRAAGTDQRTLSAVAAQLGSRGGVLESPASVEAVEAVGWSGSGRSSLGDLIFSEEFGDLVSRWSDPDQSATSQIYTVAADRERARFSTWYEMFPRSASPDHARPGTFADVRARLPYVAHMGFDVLYLPPIHPIGRTGRKGRDGATMAGSGDPGSPWAIGASEGGHRAVHPELGTLDDFRDLVIAAAARGIDVAIDLAFQASPDHPWVQEHPQWFRHLPDGTIRHAENPPKRYEDIYPLDFDTPDWQALWTELLDVVRFWVAQGVKVFRVDNPHTKPFAFWEWMIGLIRSETPEVLFLSEAFTRPKVMQELAKVGFTQSYTYFAWRNAKWELESYLTELTQSDMAEYFRPNFWPNTPDILTETLQTGARAAFMTRFVLAATLAASYGIYGPAYELQEHHPRAPGSEEYRHSEKYEVRQWDLARPDSLSEFIARVNKIRRDHSALQFNDSLHFHPVDNDQIIVYSKVRDGLSPETAAGQSGRDVIVAVVNLDHANVQSGWVELDLGVLGVDPDRPFVVHDLLSGARYTWQGARNFVMLDPAAVPAHLFSLEPTVGPPPRGASA